MTEGQRVFACRRPDNDEGSKDQFVDAIRDTGATVPAYGGDLLLRYFSRKPKRPWAIRVTLLACGTWWDVLRSQKAQNAF